MRCTAVASTERDCHFCVCCVRPFREDQSIEMTYRAYIKNTVCSLVMQTDLLSAQYNDSPTSSHCGCYSSCQRVSDKPAPLASAWLIRNEGKLHLLFVVLLSTSARIDIDWSQQSYYLVVIWDLPRCLMKQSLVKEIERAQKNLSGSCCSCGFISTHRNTPPSTGKS